MSIPNIDRCFLFLSILSAIAGMSLGIFMGVRQDFFLAPVHAHLNLLGFVTLALYGIAYRIEWASKDRLALLHFALGGTGAVLLPLGIAVAMISHQPALAMAGSLPTLASMLLFLVNCVRAQWKSGDSRMVATNSALNLAGNAANLQQNVV